MLPYKYRHPLQDLKRLIKKSYQRARFCISDEDMWNFDHAHARIMVRACDWMINNGSGYPGFLDNASVWHDELRKIKSGFEAYLDEDLIFSNETPELLYNSFALLNLYYSLMWD